MHRPAALRGALDVKIGAASTYTVAIVELVDTMLEFIDCCTFKTIHVEQLTEEIGLVLYQGSHYITIGPALKMKMPSLHQAKRWFEEIVDAAYKLQSMSPAQCSTPPCTPVNEIKKTHTRRIFSFPVLKSSARETCRNDRSHPNQHCGGHHRRERCICSLV